VTAGAGTVTPERAATILSWTKGYARQRYVRHRAIGNRTICNIALGGQIADPPDFDAATAEDCQRCFRERLAAGADIAAGSRLLPSSVEDPARRGRPGMVSGETPEQAWCPHETPGRPRGAGSR
jgi:hypothetical protein